MQNKDESCLWTRSWIARGLTKKEAATTKPDHKRHLCTKALHFLIHPTYKEISLISRPKLLLSYCFVHEQPKSQHRNFHQFSNQLTGSLKSLREMEKKINLVAKGIPVEFAHEEQHMFTWLLQAFRRRMQLLEIRSILKQFLHKNSNQSQWRLSSSVEKNQTHTQTRSMEFWMVVYQ